MRDPPIDWPEWKPVPVPHSLPRWYRACLATPSDAAHRPQDAGRPAQDAWRSARASRRCRRIGRLLPADLGNCCISPDLFDPQPACRLPSDADETYDTDIWLFGRPWLWRHVPALLPRPLRRDPESPPRWLSACRSPGPGLAPLAVGQLCAGRDTQPITPTDSLCGRRCHPDLVKGWVCRRSPADRPRRPEPASPPQPLSSEDSHDDVGGWRATTCCRARPPPVRSRSP